MAADAESPRTTDPGAAGESSIGGGDVAMPVGVTKGKSCKGCLFYSTVLKSKSRNPVCFGITRSLPQVPSHMVGEIEFEAEQEGRSLSDFKYACLGYSIFLEGRENANRKEGKHAELPLCVGIELLADRRKKATSQAPAPAHVNKEAHSQRRSYRPGQGGEDFMAKFQRNAGLVASGVARNLNKAGNYVKQTVDDILYPYRRPPK